MRFSKTSRLLICLAGLPLVCVLLYLLLWRVLDDAPPPNYIRVTFQGFTNNVLGQQLPQFSISNLTSSTIQCVNIGPQTQLTNAINRNGAIVTWAWTSGSFLRTLAPGQVTAFTVDPPANGLTWRLGVFAIKPLSSWQTYVEKAGPYLPARIYSALRGDRRRTEMVQSQEFGPTDAEKIKVR